MSMRAGKLDRLVTLEARTFVRDTRTGEQVETWAPLGDVWAEKLEGHVLERYTGTQKIAEATRGYRMRWANALLDLTSDGHRLIHGQVWNVLGVQEIGRREGVLVQVNARTEGQPAAEAAPGG
jgi:head-tail adaptor